MTTDILAKILAYKRQEVAAARRSWSLASLEQKAKAAGPPRGFRAGLLARGSGPLALIAEIKKASPSKGLIRDDFDPVALAVAYERGGAAALSVLTDRPSFMGADEHLALARSACALPCLRKDFLIDPWQVAQSRALGADAVLIILAAVDDSLALEIASAAAELGMDALFETHNETEVERAAVLGADLIGINNRDLSTFVTDLALTERLSSRIPVGATLVSESGIYTSLDVRRVAGAGAKAMLVGESLMRQTDVEAATKALLQGDFGAA